MKPLYAIKELGLVYVDAWLADKDKDLLFLSAFGRDTVIHQMLSMIQLQNNEGGMNKLTIEKAQANTVIHIPEVENLEKHISKVSTEHYGVFNHLFLFHKSLKYEKYGKETWLILPEQYDKTLKRERIWQTIKRLSDWPLLEHWKEYVIENAYFSEEPWIEELSSETSMSLFYLFGGIDAIKINLPEKFGEWLSDQVHTGILTAE